MGNSYNIVLTEKEKKEARKRLKSMGSYANKPLMCEVCGKEFTYGAPCPEHWEQVRAEHIRIQIEIEAKKDWKFKNGSNPKLDPYGLWDIFKRLSSIEYENKGSRKYFFADEEVTEDEA